MASDITRTRPAWTSFPSGSRPSVSALPSEENLRLRENPDGTFFGSGIKVPSESLLGLGRVANRISTATGPLNPCKQLRF